MTFNQHLLAVFATACMAAFCALMLWAGFHPWAVIGGLCLTVGRNMAKG